MALNYNTLIVDIGDFASSGYISQLDFSYVWDSLSPDNYETAIGNLSSTDMTININWSFNDEFTEGYIVHTTIEPDVDFTPTVTYLEATIDNIQAAAYSEAEGNGLQSKYGFSSGSTVGDIYTDGILAIAEDTTYMVARQRQTFVRLNPSELHASELSSFGNVSFILEQHKIKEYEKELREEGNLLTKAILDLTGSGALS